MASWKEIVPTHDTRVELNRETRTRRFIVRTSNEDIARTSVPNTQIGDMWPGRNYLIVSNQHPFPMSGELFELIVTYEYRPEPPEDVGESFVGFDSTAQTGHIDYDLNGAMIGAAIEGADVFGPHFVHTETHWRLSVTTAYAVIVEGLSPSLNDVPWKQFAARSLLFLGASVNREAASKWRLDYSFLGRRPVEIFKNGRPTAPRTYASGWDHVWTTTTIQETTDDDGLTDYAYVQGITHVSPVIPDGDFSTLGIGV